MAPAPGRLVGRIMVAVTVTVPLALGEAKAVAPVRRAPAPNQVADAPKVPLLDAIAPRAGVAELIKVRRRAEWPLQRAGASLHSAPSFGLGGHVRETCGEKRRGHPEISVADILRSASPYRGA